MATLSDYFTSQPLSELHPIDEDLIEREQLQDEFPNGFTPSASFRIRLVWIIGRVFYEAAAYHRAKAVRLNPHLALYGSPAPKWLKAVADVCMDITRVIAKNGAAAPPA